MGIGDKTTVDTLTDKLARMRLELAREDFLRDRKSRYFCITNEKREEYRKEENPYR